MNIVLIRHGKPTGAVNPKLSAAGFAHWVRNYNRSNVTPESLPDKDLAKSLTDHFIVSSDLARSIDSVKICLNKAPELSLKQLREMDIPRYKLPFSCHAYTWLIMNRILWFLGIEGKAESFIDAKFRAKAAAQLLQQLAKEHDNVAFFGHGLLNRYIAKELTQTGWTGNTQGKKFWSVIRLNNE